MKKHSLLVATAVAALTVGTAFAQAPSSEKSQNHMNPASQNAPAEKMSPNAGAGTHNSSASEQKSTPSSRMGQAPGSQRETTGQAPSEQKSEQKSDKMNKASQPSERNSTRANERNERNRSTTGQSTEKGQLHNRGARENSTNKANERNRSTTGQSTEKGQIENRGARENNNKVNERNRSTTGQGTMDKDRMENRGTMENRGSNENRSSTTTTEMHGRVNLSSEQRTKIHTIIVGERNAPRVSHVDFSVNVGTRVPRTIHLAPIPSEIVTIEPEWRGYEYFLVGDEIVVVDPSSMEIVAVLPA